MKSFLGFACILVCATGAFATCGPAAVVEDVTASFYGSVLGDGDIVGWSTDNETAEVAQYRLRRYDHTVPTPTMIDVATIYPAGSCGTNHDYSYADTPPAPVSKWTYRLEVWKNNAMEGYVEVVP